MQDNQTVLSGQIAAIEESHRSAEQVFYRFTIKVPRLSGNYDYLPLIVPSKIIFNVEINVGDYVKAIGEMRTMNKRENNKNKLVVFSYTHEIEKITEEEYEAIPDKNLVSVNGFVVKKPVYRKTRQGRRVTDLLVAHNRSHNKSAYIPTISWGVDATYSKNFEIGQSISVSGRFQSRNYNSKEGGTNTVYELSVANVSALH